MSWGYSILHFSELKLKVSGTTLPNLISKQYNPYVFLAAVKSFVKFSNRTDVGICFSYSSALASMICFSYIFLFSVVRCLARQSLPWCQSAAPRGAEAAEGSWEWIPGHWGAGRQRSKSWRTSLRSPVICVCTAERAEWTPALSQQLRTAPSTVLPCQALHKSWSFWQLFCFCAWACCSHKLLKLYTCLCYELSQEYPSLLIFSLLTG